MGIPGKHPVFGYFQPYDAIENHTGRKGDSLAFNSYQNEANTTSFGLENPYGRSRFEKSCLFFAKYWDLFENKTMTTQINARVD
jgi:hypothetical protein